MLKSIWTWISKERTRRTLAWLGGAVVVITGALWKVYTYEPPAKAPAVAETPAKHDEVTPAGQNAKADHGGIAINAEDDARVSVQQTTD